MNELKIEVQINTRNKLTEEQKQEVLGSIRVKVAEYLANPHDFVELSGFRIFKHFTDEELADALIKQNQ